MADHRGGGQDRAVLLDFVASMFADPTGISVPMVMEEMAWGDAGIGLAIFGTTLGVVGIYGNGTPEQVAEWVPQCFGTPDQPALAAFCVTEPDAGSDVSSMRTRAVYDEAADEWVLNGTKTWITNGGIADIHVVVASVDPGLRARGQASFIVPPGTKGLAMGQKFKKMGIRASHTAEVVLDDVRVPGRLLLGGKERLDERLARARAGQTGQRGQAALSTFETTRPAVAAQAVGVARAAYEYALAVRQGAQAVRSGHHREPGHRLQAGRDAHAHRRRPPAGLERLVARGERSRVRRRPGVTVEAVRRRDRGAGHRRRHPDPRRRRLYPGPPGGALASRRQDLHHLRGDQRDPAPGDRPGHLRFAYRVRRGRPQLSVVVGTAWS